MDNSTQYELMRYIDDEMLPGEKAEFEKRLAVDAVLQNDLRSLQLTREAVKQYGLKEKVGGIHRQMMKELATGTPVKPISQARRIVRYVVAIAASVLLIFMLIEGYKFYALSPEKLYAQNYTAYELTTTRDGMDSLTAIEKAYRQKNYSEVIKLNAGSVVSIKEIFLTGMAYLETKDYSRAISSFQIVITDIKDHKTVIKDAAEYYLALAYLQNSDYDQAIELMNAIRNNSSHLYKAKFNGKYINRVKRLKWR
ncbi:MAG TPA: tetratricopeptide repeat protein [Chitinophagaceae bacterium]|nr:tetratricopeptide repeat protein [Chitinophagaceae bacterium]